GTIIQKVSARERGSDDVSGLLCCPRRSRVSGAGGQIGVNGRFQLRGRLGQPEVIEEQSGRENSGRGVGLRRAGDIGSGAVNRLKHTRVRATRVDAATRGEPDPARYGGRQVGENIAEEVIGHNDVKTSRVGDHVDGGGIDMDIVHVNI